MAVSTVMTQLASIQEEVAGVKKAYDNIPDVIEDGLLPLFINVYEGSDLVTPRMMGLREWTHHIRMQLLFSLGTDLALAEKQARPFVNSVVTMFDQNKTANGTAQSVDIRTVDYTRVTLVDGGPTYLGLVFRTDVQEQDTVVYAP